MGPSSSEQAEKQKENAQRLLSALKNRRIQKVLIYLAYGRGLPHPVPEEEEELYAEIKKVLEKGSKIAKSRKIKILAQIPEILTPKGYKIGPYTQNQIVETDNEADIAFIISNKIGETIM